MSGSVRTNSPMDWGGEGKRESEEGRRGGGRMTKVEGGGKGRGGEERKNKEGRTRESKGGR